MMVEGLIFDALKGLVGNRCYPLTFAQPDSSLPTWPAIRYSIISSVNEPDICGTDTVDTDDVTVQLDLVARTHGAVVTLRDNVIAVMMALGLPATRQGNGSQEFDAETKTYRVTLEYLVSQSSGMGSP